MTTYTDEVNVYNPEAIANGIADAGETATNYLTVVDQTGLMVHPATDSTTGWKISSAIELLKSNVSYIKLWLESSVAKLRLGLENAGHAIFSSNGMDVYTDSTTKVAEFGDQITLGETASGNYALIDSDSFDIYHSSTNLAHFGYDDGNEGENGSTELAPYFTFGTRDGSTAREYDPTKTYWVGELAIHDGVLHTCIVKAEAEAWDSSHWKLAIGSYSTSEGRANQASGDSSHAEGQGTKAIGDYSHSEGRNTKAIGHWSHAEGFNSIASGIHSHAEGSNTEASGAYSHAEGDHTTASGSESHAEGWATTASGNESHAEGIYTTASGNFSHAEGSYNTASGNYSHVEGRDNEASGACSHASGYYTLASGDYQTVVGKFNAEDTNDSYAFIVGNGSGINNRTNAFSVDWTGNASFAGDVSIGASKTANTVLAAPNGSAGAPSFRSLVAADLPTVTVAKGGTGKTNLTAYQPICGGTTTTGALQSVSSTNTGAMYRTSTTALPVWGTLPVAQGGTGKTSGAFHSCTQLYNSTTGSNGTITLSASVANYDYLAVWTIDNNSKNPRISWIATRKANTTSTVMMFEASSNTGTLFRRVLYTISGTSMTPSYGNYIQNTAPSTWSSGTAGTNYVKVTRVMGYVI